MNSNPIGIFDSGVGGLSVYSELIKLLPDEDYIYIGDTKNSPYGTKTKEELIDITRNIFEFFKFKKVKAVVMACNTTSALTYDTLKNEYDFKIYPLVQNVSETIALMDYHRIGVFATKATVDSHAYKNYLQKINPDISVFETACQEWVSIVEQSKMFELSSIGNIKLQVDRMMENNPDKIILGCTHYPYLLSILSRFAPKEKFINPAVYFAQYICNNLDRADMLNKKHNQETIFYVTENPEQFKTASQIFCKADNVVELSLAKA